MGNDNGLRALMVNPWITDLAAYDLWARPLGLLMLGGLLRARGWDVGLIDCLDRGRSGPGGANGRDDGQGCGKYRRERLETPGVLAELGRPFCRYGIATSAFDAAARRLGPPDVILLTSRMTYWYPGVLMAARRLRALWPRTPIVLGGVYPTLCPDHAARFTEWDYRVAGEGENALLALLGALFPGRVDATPVDLSDLDALPPPAWDLCAMGQSPAIMLSRGCPMRCSYCAGSRMAGAHRRRDPERVADEVVGLIRDAGAEDFAFYDDALLAQCETSFLPFLESLARRGARARFHTPNGIHTTMVNDTVAQAMAAAGFQTLRLSLETSNADHLTALNRPMGVDRFLDAMAALRGAGFTREQLGVYLLAALPGQSEAEAREAIDLVIEAGGTPRVGEFSPLPGTPEFDRTVVASGLPLSEEPLLQNNSVFHRLAPWSRDGMVDRLQRYARERLRQT